jgi:hypothetical protein
MYGLTVFKSVEAALAAGYETYDLTEDEKGRIQVRIKKSDGNWAKALAFVRPCDDRELVPS